VCLSDCCVCLMLCDVGIVLLYYLCHTCCDDVYDVCCVCLWLCLCICVVIRGACLGAS